jgi:hypothetical protein
MHKHIAMDLADRLESGQYLQGKGTLCEAGEFCCLGVLSEMGVEAGIAVKVPLGYSDAIKYVDVESDDYDYRDESAGVLTRNIMEWAGMRTASGEFQDDDLEGFGALTTANDNRVDFPRIARYIRENYETL